MIPLSTDDADQEEYRPEKTADMQWEDDRDRDRDEGRRSYAR